MIIEKNLISKVRGFLTLNLLYDSKIRDMSPITHFLPFARSRSLESSLKVLCKASGKFGAVHFIAFECTIAN